jgi:RNA polymerase sigma-70 factor (ECF subfamily)
VIKAFARVAVTRSPIVRVLGVSRLEAELVSDLRQGSSAAFDALYARHAPRVLRFVRVLCRNSAVADDLFQETWLKLAQHARGLAPEVQVLPWLLRVARNAWISRLRRETRLVPLPESESTELSTPEAEQDSLDLAVDRVLLVRVVGEALMQLSDRDREVLSLVGVEQLPQEEAAQILEITVVALRQRLSRARARLLALLPTSLRADTSSKGGVR